MTHATADNKSGFSPFTFLSAGRSSPITVQAADEAVARTLAMTAVWGAARPFGLAPDSATDPVRPRPAAVYPTEWRGLGLARTRESGMFRDHSCWKCKDGARPCVVGNPRQCEYPHARND